ncbi:MAG: hypothetical protein PHC28_09220 [Flavobacterium sp.]|uniref:STM3941 family protein n=1 Tax=Flavobacterium sp. TaxID=239 RepID=UPI00262C33BE|nr:STM3941 family protein [Flavobacterium sp.]MDD5150649.1 hypothetical protein [Flavobacterium sp.]
MPNKLEDRNLYYDCESLEIPINKTKVISTIFIAILFIVLGFWFVFSFATMQTKFNPLLIQILGIASILFFGLALIFTIPKYFDKSPGLIFTNKGIVDNTNGTSVGLIKWKDITEIKVIEIWKTKAILLETNQSEKYIAKANPNQAKIMRANFKIYGTPLCITPQTLKIDFEDLYDLIFEEFSLHKKYE